jgi:hypothetical protein
MKINRASLDIQDSKLKLGKVEPSESGQLRYALRASLRATS